MERVQFKAIMKKIFAILLIVAILVPYFPKMTFAAQVAEPEEVATLVNNVVNWKSGNQAEEGTSDQEFTLKYSATFNRITTGFRDVNILIYTNQVQGVTDVLTVDSSAAGTKETGNGYATIHLDAVNTGINYTGEVTVQFGKASTELDRKVYYKVTGYYTDPEKGDMYFETAITELNAHIVPQPDNFPFNFSLSHGTYGYYNYSYSPNITTTTQSLGNNDNGTSKGWYTKSLTVSYPIKLQAYEKAQHAKLQLTFFRYSQDESAGENAPKVSEMGLGYSINYNELKADFGTPTITTNEDGSVTYTFEKGNTSTNTYNENNVFSLNKQYFVYMTYDTTHSNPVIYGNDATFRSNFDFVAKFDASGYKIVETYDNNTKQLNRTVTYEEKTANLGDTRAKNLYLYTPGNHTWIQATAGSATVGDTEYQADGLDSNIMEIIRNDKKVDIKFTLDIEKIGESLQYDSTTGEFTPWENVTGKINVNPPTMGYISDSTAYYGMVRGAYYGSYMQLKSIKPLEGTTGTTKLGTGTSNGDLTYSTPGNNSIQPGETFILAQSVNNFNVYAPTSGFCLFLEDFLNKEFTGYELTYTLDLSSMTDDYIDYFINNCLTLSVNFARETRDRSDYYSEWVQGNDGFVLYGPDNNYDNNYSWFTGDNDATSAMSSSADMLNKWESKTIIAKMKAIEDGSISDKTVHNNTINENPIFYLELPSNFSYKNINVTVGESLKIKKQYIRKYNNKKYLVFECDGTYDSRIANTENITITFDRKLLKDASSYGNYNLYMFTDNKNYYGSSGTYGINNNEVGQLWSVSYSVVGSSKKEALTTIEKDGRNYIPNPSNDIDDDGEKQYPLLVNANNRVTFDSRVSAQGSTMSNVTILSRLPFANNTQLYKDTNEINQPLIESDYKITNTNFWNKKGANVNTLTSSDVISQLTMTDLQIEGVYLLQNAKDVSTATAIDSSKYKIYYTTQADADFDSTSFVEYDPEGTNSDFAQAKNIKVVFDESYTINSGYSALVKYSMQMPNEVGMVGAATGIRYTSDNVEDYLYSPTAYVINGNENVNIEVQKKFELLDVGVAPTELTNGLAGIQFKLYYFDETTGEVVYLKDNQNNVVIATTDANGVAKFLNIPAREYVLEEVTTFDNYQALDGILLDLEPGDTLKAADNIVENPLKRSTVVITKLWNEQQDPDKRISLRLTSKVDDDYRIKYAKNGVITFNNVPYGEYTITESTGVDGWTAETPVKDLQVYQPEVNTTFNNVPSTATMKIVKTVPSRESVVGLSFKVTGRGKVSYYDENHNIQTTDSETTFKIGDESTYGNNISVELSNGNRTATITIENLYLGLYTIEEIDMPNAGNTDITMYQPVKQTTTLSEQGSEVVVDILNNYKYGTLEINKTAKLREKNKQTNQYEYSTIGDLSSFLVRVSGTSYYGTEVNETVALDVNGHGSVDLEIGKYTVTEVENVPHKGFTAYYGTDRTASIVPPEVTVKYDETVTQDIYNEFTGVGYVRVEKTLDDNPDPQAVIDAGIQFVITGRNLAGGRVSETIDIDKIDPVKNVAYGVSGAISAYGEYGIEEVSSTVPRFYEAANSREIQITCDNTQDNPLIVNAVNTRGIGQLEIRTTTNPKGGPLNGICYKVTEVNINDNGTYTKVGDATTVYGSNDEGNLSFAKLDYLKAGYYLVEQTLVPDGWIKDLSQIVEVPMNNTGYANFEITQKQALKTNNVYINKIVLNKNGEEATEEDITAAKLDANESFEVKITNIETGAVYYVFTSANKQGVIQGLDEGTYSIEEVYKPKYVTEGYYKNVEVPGEIEGALPTIELNKITETQGQGYLFTVTEDENTIKDVTLTIKNTINTDFGFGGQNSADNLGKVEVEEGAITYSTRAIIYVLDENNNAIDGFKFSLYNLNEQLVTLTNLGSVFEIYDKKLIIRGLPVGEYTLKCVEYPNGYLKPDDMHIYVFSDAALAQKIEVKKNVPRGSLTLGTRIVEPDGSSEYVSRSKYKIVNPSTGEVLKFVRTYTGDYEKSNLDEASPLISLKAGTVDVTGLEVGTYEVGLVDVTDGYGIVKTTPETVQVVQNTPQDVIVNVVPRGVKAVRMGYNSTTFLDEAGNLYFRGYQDSYVPLAADGNSNYHTVVSYAKIKFPVDDVKIVKYTLNYYFITALDSEGRIWIWGRDYYSSSNKLFNKGTITTPYHIVPDDINKFDANTKFVDVVSSDYAQTVMALDENGKLYIAGNGNPGYSGFSAGLKKVDFFDNENESIRISKLVKLNYSSDYRSNYTLGAIDSAGRLWTWGNNTITNGTGLASDTPVCISDTANMYNIVDAVTTEWSTIALDNDGNVWIWGTGMAVNNDMITENFALPHKLASSYFNNKKIEKITVRNNMAAVIDEDGNVWTWGSGVLGQDGNSSTTSGVPVCITAENKLLEGKAIKDIDININNYYQMVVAADTDDNILTWGASSATSYLSPKYDDGAVLGRLDWCYESNLEYNLKFKEVYCEGGSYFAIDDIGRLWAWGSNSGYKLGFGDNSSTVSSPQVVPGTYNIKKVASHNDVSLALSEEGKVYYCGGNATKTFTDITKLFNLPADSMITDIYVCRYSSGTGAPGTYAIDSKGKVYLIRNTVYQSNSSIKDINIECISHDSDGDIYIDNARIIKITGVASYGYNYMYGLSADGKIYGIQYNHYGTDKKQILMTPAGVTFVDIAHNYALDSDGVLWRITSDSNQYVSAKTEGFYHTTLYNYYQNPDYKVLAIYDGAPSTYDRNILIKQSTGQYLYINDSSFNSLSNTISNYDKFSFDTYRMSSDNMLLIDKSGELLVDNAYAGGTSAKSYSVIANPMYNIKMNHIYGDQFVSDVNGQLYYFKGSSNNYDVQVIGAAPSEALARRLNIKKLLTPEMKAYSSTATVCEALALDNDGKIWYATPNDIYCLNDSTDNAIGRRQKQNPNFKIVDIYYTTLSSYVSPSYYQYYALDNEGKLWAWGVSGSNYYGQIPGASASTYVSDPICINNLPGVDMENIQSFEIQQLYSYNVYIAKGLNGNVWVWGYNGNGILGNDTTTPITTPYHLNTQIGNREIVDIQFNKYDCAVLLCTDGSIYVTGKSGYNSDTSAAVTYKSWTYIASVEGAKKVVPLMIATNCGTFMIFVDKVDSNTNQTTEEIWTFGFNSTSTTESYCGLDDLTSKYISVPQKVMNNDIDGLTFVSRYGSNSSATSACVRVMDTTGNVYGWYKDSSTGKFKFQFVVDLNVKLQEIFGNNYNLAEIAKILIKEERSATTYCFVGNGKVWNVSLGCGVIRSNSNVSVPIVEGAEPVECRYSAKVIDSAGNLYVYGQYSGLSTLSSWVCTTTKKYKTDGEISFNEGMVKDATQNPMYGTKFKELINDRFAIDTDDNVWYFPTSGAAINLTETEAGVENPLYGKNIKKFINDTYLVTTDNEVWYHGTSNDSVSTFILKSFEDDKYTIIKTVYATTPTGSYAVALDNTTGKVWVNGTSAVLGIEGNTTNGTPICLNDIEGSAFKDVKVIKVIPDTTTPTVIDENGKVWRWNDSTHATPTCITDIVGTDLYNAYQNNIKMTDVVEIYDINGKLAYALKDSTGQIWYATSTSVVRVQDSDTIIGLASDEKIVAVMQNVRLSSSGKLYVLFPTGEAVNGTTYPKALTTFRLCDDVAGVTIPTVTEVFPGQVDTSSSIVPVVALANTADGVYRIITRYNKTSYEYNYTCLVKNIDETSNAKITKFARRSASQILYIDDNNDLWLCGLKHKYFSTSNSTEYAYYQNVNNYNYDGVLQGKKYENVEYYGKHIILTTKATETQEKQLYSVAEAADPVLVDNDATVELIYGSENVDDAHRKELFAHSTHVEYFNNKYYRISNGKTAYEYLLDYLLSRVNGIGVIEEVVGEYEVRNSDGAIYSLVPKTVSTYQRRLVSEVTPFSSDTPISPISIDGVTFVKQTQHKALDNKGNLYVWDRCAGLADYNYNDGIFNLSGTQYTSEPVYSAVSGWTVVTKAK